MIWLNELWRLVSGEARQEAEHANETAYQTLDRKLCARGIGGLMEIDRMMRQKANGHDRPASR